MCFLLLPDYFSLCYTPWDFRKERPNVRLKAIVHPASTVGAPAQRQRYHCAREELKRAQEELRQLRCESKRQRLKIGVMSQHTSDKRHSGRRANELSGAWVSNRKYKIQNIKPTSAFKSSDLQSWSRTPDLPPSGRHIVRQGRAAQSGPNPTT